MEVAENKENLFENREVLEVESKEIFHERIVCEVVINDLE
jgi:hypothetical protein